MSVKHFTLMESESFWMAFLTTWDEASGHFRTYWKRNGNLRTKTGFISILTVTAAIMMVSGTRGGKNILNWSSSINCVKNWVEMFDIDGLRLDVAYSLDRNFMKRLCSFTKELKPDFALIGEVLFGDYNLIVNDEMLHSCTNYECYKGLYSSFNDMNLFEIAHSLNRQFGPEQWCIYRGKHLMTFADNHDVTRLASILKNPAHLPLVYGILFGMPGIPCIYYGSEWGEEGMKAPDNDFALRPCFEVPKPNSLTKFLKNLIHIRQNSDALCNGSYRNIIIQNHQLIFERMTEHERIFVALNASETPFTAYHQDLNGTVADLITDEEIAMTGSLKLPGYSVQYLKF